MLHVRYIYLHLAFGWFLGHMLVNIPYMEHMGNDMMDHMRCIHPTMVIWKIHLIMRLIMIINIMNNPYINHD
jgi:hypothetical protein